jgi:hypothetical protein
LLQAHVGDPLGRQSQHLLRRAATQSLHQQSRQPLRTTALFNTTDEQRLPDSMDGQRSSPSALPLGAEQTNGKPTFVSTESESAIQYSFPSRNSGLTHTYTAFRPQ